MRRFFLALLFVLIPFGVLAHSGEASLEKQVGNYLVDIGYLPGLVSMKDVYFSYGLVFHPDEKTWEIQVLDKVHVNISDIQGNTVIDKTVHQDSIASPIVTVRFPQDGEYVMDVKYLQNEQSLVQASFPLHIGATRNAGIPSMPAWLQYSVGILVLVSVSLYGGIIGWKFYRGR
jgi:uncharacterized protein YkuJ